MAIAHITITDLGQDAQGKCNDLMDETQVSGSIIPGNQLLINKFGGGTTSIQLPYSQDQINVGLITTIIGVGPYSTNTTAGSYQISGVIYSIGAVTNFPIPAVVAPDNRIDLIYGDNTSTLLYLTGTPSVLPTEPTVPVGAVAIAYIYVPNIGAPTIYTPNPYTDVDPGTTVGSHLIQNGVKQIENVKTLFTVSTLNIIDSDFNSSQDNGINSYTINGTKTLTDISQFRYSDNSVAGLFLQDTKFSLYTTDNTNNVDTYIRTFGESGNLKIRSESASYTLDMVFNSITPTILISNNGTSQTTQFEKYRLNLGGNANTITNVSANYNILSSDSEIYVNTSGGSYSLVLPSALVVPIGQSVIVKDSSGNAFLNQIVVTASGGLTIDGGLSQRISYNHGSLTFTRVSGTNQAVTQSYNKSSNAVTGSAALLSYNNNVGVTAIAVAGTQYVANITSAATTNLTNQTQPAANRITYNAGAPSRTFQFTLSMTLSTTVNNRLLGCSLRKNGIIINGAIHESYCQTANQPEQMSITQMESVAGGDYFELAVRNAGGTENINVKHYTIVAVEVQK